MAEEGIEARLRRAGGTGRPRGALAAACWLGLLALFSSAAAGAERGADAEQEGWLEAIVPVGAWGTRTLHDGEWRVSYAYSRDHLDGNRDGRERRSVAEVRADGFGEIPLELSREEHLFALEFAPVERVTLRAELPVWRFDLDEVGPTGSLFHLRESGVGDLRIQALVPFIRRGGQQLQVGLGLSFPTGSIQGGADTPGGRERLPYPLRLGSGTFDLSPILGYIGSDVTSQGQASWGFQWQATERLADNDRGYTLGDSWEFMGWFAWSFSKWLSASTRLAWSEWDEIDGLDPDLDLDSPAADPGLQGGSRLDLSPGLVLSLPCLRGQELGIEASFPVYQKLDGPQLEGDWKLSVAWRWRFGGAGR